ncbi:MAG: hypothetical protein DRN04_08620 [Thermoprotei archaeon]|nr:MAG: hypothetical protein DRN04_08620 [Thermoprotei archaeon]
MIDLFAEIFSLVIIATGIVSLIAASRIEPNVFLGFRLPSTLASRRVWRKINRLAGAAATAVGLISLILSFTLSGVCAIMFAVVSLTTIVGSLSLYSSLILERETGKEEGGDKPVKVLPVIKASLRAVVVAFVLLTIVALCLCLFYPTLPEVLAVHFNVQGDPDYFMSKSGFTVFFLILSFATVYSLSAVLLSARGAPLLEDRRKKEYVLTMIKIIEVFLAAVPLVLALVVFEIIYYNICCSHFVHPGILAIASVVMLVALLIFSLRR